MAVAERDFPSWIRERVLARGRVVILCQGRSMQPAIPEGAYVEVRPVAFHELSSGDLVVFAYGGECFCHRLLRKTDRLLILKGDTLLWADPPVVWQQVVGRVSTIIRDGVRLVPLDHPWQRRRAYWRARLSYPYAVLHHVLRAGGRLANWHRGVRLPGD